MPRTSRFRTRPRSFSLARVVAVPVVVTLAALAGCAEERPSDLVGSMHLHFTGSDYTVDFGLAAPATKFRAQVVDDGETCRLDLDVDDSLSGLHAWSRLTALESAPLLAGASASVTAGDRAAVVDGQRQPVIVDAATFVLVTSDATQYSTGGTIVIDPLPAARGLLRVHLQGVVMHTVGGGREDEALQADIELTYIGRNALDHTRSACPALAPIPPGIVY